MFPTTESLLKEITFKTSRSGGSGGQNVNKVETKVKLIFNIQQSELFSQEEKELLIQNLQTKLDAEGNIHIISQEDRSQLSNKENAVGKFVKLLIKSLKVPKKRKPTKIPRAVKLKRLENKSAVADKKSSRRKPDLE